MRIQYQTPINEPVRIGSTLVAFENGISEEITDELGHKFLKISSYSKVNDPVDMVLETITSGEIVGVVLDTPTKPKRRKTNP